MNRPVDLPLHALDLDEIDLNNSGNESFNAVLDARLSRRSVLRGGVGRRPPAPCSAAWA